MIGTAELQAESPPAEGAPLIVYRGVLDGKLWVRPAHEFFDGRFDQIGPTPAEERQEAVRMVLTMAPSFQGGHSEVGREVAALLGVGFPLNMDDLDRKARSIGLEPAALWPWRR